jgi:hypothetical protein
LLRSRSGSRIWAWSKGVRIFDGGKNGLSDHYWECILIILADMILASHAAYISMLFPLNIVLVLVSEVAVFRFYQRSTVNLGNSIWLVVVANALSWLIGFVVAGFLMPSGLEQRSAHGFIERSPHYGMYALLSFLFAFIFSVLIEYGFYRTFQRRYHFQRLGTCTFMANLASYLLLGIAVICLFYFHVI